MFFKLPTTYYGKTKKIKYNLNSFFPSATFSHATTADS